MKQVTHLQAKSPSGRITENLLGRLQITICFRPWKQYKKQMYFLGERAGCFTINSVLASALIGVVNARYICLALSFDCLFLPVRVFFFVQKGESTRI